MSKYAFWTTKDGRQIPVVQMENDHLVNTIRAIEEGRIFPCSCDAFDLDMSGHEHVVRENWLTVLKGEALRRGLDWSKPAFKRMKLVDYLLSQIEDQRERWVVEMLLFDARREINEPELDVSATTGKPTYYHWVDGVGLGQRA